MYNRDAMLLCVSLSSLLVSRRYSGNDGFWMRFRRDDDCSWPADPVSTRAIALTFRNCVLTRLLMLQGGQFSVHLEPWPAVAD